MSKIIKLSRKEKLFADGILEGKNKGESAIDSYNIKSSNKGNVGGSIASQNLKKLKIIKYLEENGYGAATRIVKLSKNAKNETVKLNANKDILDRIGSGVKQPINAFQFNFNNDKEEFR